jgi:hypothetical protein
MSNQRERERERARITKITREEMESSAFLSHVSQFVSLTAIRPKYHRVLRRVILALYQPIKNVSAASSRTFLSRITAPKIMVIVPSPVAVVVSDADESTEHVKTLEVARV